MISSNPVCCRATSQSTLGTFQTDYLKFVARHRHPLFYLFHPCLLASFSVAPDSLFLYNPASNAVPHFPCKCCPRSPEHVGQRHWRAPPRKPRCSTSCSLCTKPGPCFCLERLLLHIDFTGSLSYVGLLSFRLRPPALHFDYSIYLSCSSSYIAAPSPCACPLSCISIQV